ncbi:MAG: TolC family protein [Verrucomicrobiales bacterium]
MPAARSRARGRRQRLARGRRNPSCADRAAAWAGGRPHVLCRAKAASLQRAAEAAADSFAANLRVAQDRRKAGAGLRTESLDLEVRLAEAREQITQAKHARALAALALAQLLGIDGRVALDPDCACPAEPPAESEAQRPEIAAAADRSEAARHAARAAKAASRPQVEAFAAAEGVAGSEFGGSGANYTAGIALRWNLWDGGAAKAARQRADAEASAAAEMHRKARLGVQREIAAAELNAAEAAERLAVSAKAVTLAEESANLTRSQFEQGAATASQVVDAETALTAARVRHAQADADRRLAIATWRYALGLPLLDQ